MEVNKLKIIHQPVLEKEVISNLIVRSGGIYVDATLGEGGHAEAIISKLGPQGYLIGIDWDERAVIRAKRRLSVFKNKLIVVRENYKALPGILKHLGIKKIDGILLDLGVSSLQLESRQRGFSFRFSAPLDMRMDEHRTIKAGDLVNKLSEKDLKKIFFQFGEERYSKKIAKNIIKSREDKPLEGVLDLAAIIKKSIPGKSRFNRLHPATRIFQALRITVNQELDNLKLILDESVHYLNKGARIAVISYHSLEDRLVKNFFKKMAETCICPPGFPVCCCKIQPQFKTITKKAIKPKELEIEKNPRSRSAKLRIAEKL